MTVNRLGGHSEPEPSMADSLKQLAEYSPEGLKADAYGVGQYIEDFEAEIASMFGFEAGVFMPSGTMAQQIALRIWADSAKNPLVAMHPTAHLETAEQLGYQHLHGLRRVQFGVPEFVSERMLNLSDLEGLGEKPSVLLLELPMRPLGGQLPDWEELLAIRAWCYEHDVKLHLDGARIWSCLPHFNKTYSDIGALFDSIYVSFYKDLGGLCGCVLLGSENFIDESRVWQRRHGGNLYTQFPFVVSAKRGLDKCLPEMSNWVSRAREIAGIMNQVDGVKTQPEIPQCNIFRVFLKGEAEALQEKHDELEKQTNTRLFGGFMSVSVPGWSVTEVHCWENSITFDERDLAGFLADLVAA